ncbi:flagellar export chaperone FliS [Desulfocurvibacter africanus]|uniref:flagellar export chaperone FliS n=1 Tax=Desulfocurvibacter africanus TaxID=873 RepID=UPI002FDA1A2A
MYKAAQKYLATQVTTTDQGQLLIMLYDATIKFLNQAKIKIDEKDYAQKGILISKALDIISELASSLNKDKGGDIADNLNQVYLYCNTRLLMANLKMDKGIIDEVIKIITGVRDAYAQIIKEGATAPTAGVDTLNTQAVSRSSFGAPKIGGTGMSMPPITPKAAQFAAPTEPGKPAEASHSATIESAEEQETGQPSSSQPQAASTGEQPSPRQTATPLAPSPAPSGTTMRRVVQAYGNTPK